MFIPSDAESTKSGVDRSGTSDPTFQRFYNLFTATIDVLTWLDYLPQDRIKSIAEIVEQHVAEAESIVREESMNDEREGHIDGGIKNSYLTTIVGLRRLVPGMFRDSGISFSDADLKSIEKGGLGGFRDGRDQIRKLFTRARIAEYDPARFRNLFISEFPADRRAASQTGWERWDYEHPMEVPKCASAWRTICEALDGGSHE